MWGATGCGAGAYSCLGEKQKFQKETAVSAAAAGI